MEALELFRKLLAELQLVPYSSIPFQRSLFFIFFSPLFWNFNGRLEHRFRVWSRLFGGNPRQACYCFAAAVFVLSAARDELYRQAVAAGGTPMLFLPERVCRNLAGTTPPCVFVVYLFVVGSVLVAASFYQLGVVGTYLGDHFGILMPHRITAFPFNYFSHPMYEGSTFVFLSYALWHRSMTGIVLSFMVACVYCAAATLEGPFTARIYAGKAASAKAGKGSPSAGRRLKVH